MTPSATKLDWGVALLAPQRITRSCRQKPRFFCPRLSRTPAPRFMIVNEPDGQGRTVRPQASFSFFAKAFLSDEVPPPLS